MNINLIPTNEYYHRIIGAPDAARRRELFLELFVAPWRQMMDAMGGMLGPDAAGDPLAGARACVGLVIAGGSGRGAGIVGGARGGGRLERGSGRAGEGRDKL